MSPVTVSPVIVALAGALVGGLIAELRAWLQSRREEHRTLRRVLHQQLEIRHAFLRANPVSFLDAFASVLGKRYGVDQALAKSELRKQEQFREAFIELVSVPFRESLEQRYEAAVESLGEVDPLLAFQLSGKSALTRFRERMVVYTTRLTGANKSPEQGAMAQLDPLLDDTIYPKTLQVLDDDIRDVAGALNWSVKRNVTRLLERTAHAPEDMGRELEEWFERAELIMASSNTIPTPSDAVSASQPQNGECESAPRTEAEEQEPD